MFPLQANIKRTCNK